MTRQIAPHRQPSRPHVYELDPLRVVTILCVAGVHVAAFTVFLNRSTLGMELQNAFVVSLHYTRELFLFVTGFALTYVYYGKPFQLKRFWKKRSIGTILPYCIWSAVYIWVNLPQLSFGQYLSTTFFALLNGSASYQLYYILLTIQFYIILPVFLLFLQRVKNHPWTTLSISFLIQLLLLYLDYHSLQAGSLPSTGIWQFINQYQGSFILTYQFYFILGGFAALYIQPARSFVRKHGAWIASGFAVALLALWIHFFVQINVYHESMGFATSVLQPIMTFYSLAVIVFLCWIVSLWTKQSDQDNQGSQPKGYRFWHILSDASFGVYLIHVLFLTALLRTLVPAMPSIWPVALRVFLTWFLTASVSFATTIILMNIPIVSRLVGRSRSSERLNNVGVRMKHVFIHTSTAESKQHEHKPPRDMQPV